MLAGCVRRGCAAVLLGLIAAGGPAPPVLAEDPGCRFRHQAGDWDLTVNPDRYEFNGRAYNLHLVGVFRLPLLLGLHTRDGGYDWRRVNLIVTETWPLPEDEPPDPLALQTYLSFHDDQGLEGFGETNFRVTVDSWRGEMKGRLLIDPSRWRDYDLSPFSLRDEAQHILDARAAGQRPWPILWLEMDDENGNHNMVDIEATSWLSAVGQVEDRIRDLSRRIDEGSISCF